MEKSELIQQIIELQRRVNRVLRDTTTDVWMDLSLTNPQIRSLFFIADQGSTNFTKLAERLKTSSSNVTGIIDRLVEQDLVSRAENPLDRRATMLQTTKKGEALVAELRERRSDYLSQALIGLSVEELNEIVRGLKILTAATESQGVQIKTGPD